MILADTGPLVALCDARDSKHRAAVRDLASVAAEGIAVCEAVLTEACVHLRHHHQRERLRALLHRLHVTPVPATTESLFWFDAFDWLSKFADHDPDWADACLAVLSGRDRAARVWTYDAEFRTIWRRLDGSPIPLVSRRVRP